MPSSLAVTVLRGEGETAVRRLLRLVTWRGAPQELLPAGLTEVTGIPRRIDGVLVLPR